KPMTLDPAKPGSFELVSDLLGQLLPNFSSSYVHLGMDEPFELPAERSEEWSGWLQRLLALDVVKDRSAMVWGDHLDAHPSLLDLIPEGVTVCEWGYEAGHPFPAYLERLAERGVPSVVSPGTSSWISLAGRAANAIKNVQEAARAGLESGSVG
ncbi:glycoside hydrolase family protein, partial [mine drainage metagenome]